MILLSHPTGNQNVRHALNALNDSATLAEFVTTIATFDGSLFGRLAATRLGADFERRRFSEYLAELTKQQPWWEMGRMVSKLLGLNNLSRHERGMFCVDAVYRHLDIYASRRVDYWGRRAGLRAVYAYEDGALETFSKAKSFGIKCIYDLPIAYFHLARRLLEEEAQRHPAWRATLVGTLDSNEKLERKEKELELADLVICPSKFVRDSLPEDVLRTKPIHVIPFGSPEVIGGLVSRFDINRKKLRVLFVGSMSQRKGLADLFEAMKLLDPARYELHVLGSTVVEMSFYRKQFSSFVYHTPRVHAQVLELMKACDVFVLPSIVEGRALVQQEALASGLPIIVTPNAGGEDLVADQQAGFLVPIRNPEAIAVKLELLGNDREFLCELKTGALNKAKEVGWAAYRQELSRVTSTLGH